MFDFKGTLGKKFTEYGLCVFEISRVMLPVDLVCLYWCIA